MVFAESITIQYLSNLSLSHGILFLINAKYVLCSLFPLFHLEEDVRFTGFVC